MFFDVTKVHLRAVCGITVEGMRLDGDEWFYSDFCLHWHLLSGLALSEKWFAVISPRDLIETKYYKETQPQREILNGNPYQDRRVVLSKQRNIIPEKNIVVHSQWDLKNAFLEDLKNTFELAHRRSEGVLLMFLSHGEPETFAVQMGDEEILLQREEVKALADGYPGLKLSLILTSCFSGGWVDEWATMMTAAGEEAESQSWPETPGSKRCSGGIYTAAIVRVLAGLDPQESRSFDQLRKDVKDSLEFIDRFHDQHQIQAQAIGGNNDMEWREATNIPLDSYKARLEALPTVAPVSGDGNHNLDRSSDEMREAVQAKRRSALVTSREYANAGQVFMRGGAAPFPSPPSATHLAQPRSRDTQAESPDLLELPRFALAANLRYGKILSHKVLQRKVVGQAAKEYYALNPGNWNWSNNRLHSLANRCLDKSSDLLSLDDLEITWNSLQYRIELAFQAKILLKAMGIVPCCPIAEFEQWKVKYSSDEEEDEHHRVFVAWRSYKLLPSPSDGCGREFLKPDRWITHSLWEAGFREETIHGPAARAKEYTEKYVDGLAKTLKRHINSSLKLPDDSVPSNPAEWSDRMTRSVRRTIRKIASPQWDTPAGPPSKESTDIRRRNTTASPATIRRRPPLSPGKRSSLPPSFFEQYEQDPETQTPEQGLLELRVLTNIQQLPSAETE